jgi:hypothetical protein
MHLTMTRTLSYRPDLPAKAHRLLGERTGEAPLILELLAAFAAQSPHAMSPAKSAREARHFAQLAVLIPEFWRRGGAVSHLMSVQRVGTAIVDYAGVGGYTLTVLEVDQITPREGVLRLLRLALPVLGWQSPLTIRHRRWEAQRQEREVAHAAMKETQRQRRLARFQAKHGW